MDWPTIVVLGLLMIFIVCLFYHLLQVKRIDSENTIRFACIEVGILIIFIVAFVPIANGNVATGLFGLVSAIFGYVIRDVAKTWQGKEEK